MTKNPSKTCKSCLFRNQCELTAGLFKFWNSNEARCVKKHQVLISKQLSDSTSLKTRIKPIPDRMKVVDENGRELSNVELRRRFGQGKGYHLKGIKWKPKPLNTTTTTNNHGKTN